MSGGHDGLDREDRTRLAAGENDELPPRPDAPDIEGQPAPEERFALDTDDADA